MKRECAARRSQTAILLAASLFLLAPPARGQDLTLSGQVRIRAEVKDPTGVSSTRETFTSMRARLALRATANQFATFIQFQDVKLWGAESEVGLHQGWITWTPSEPVAARFGRQEVSYGGQRLVGALDWAQRARSLDGARFMFRPSTSTDVEVFAFNTAESFSGSSEQDENFLGAYGVWGFGDPGRLDFFWFFQRAGSVPGKTRQWTTGARWVGIAGPLVYRAEGAWQGGERGGGDVGAYLLGLRLGADFAQGRAGLTLWADVLSGSEEGSTDVGAFETLFATNHKFYGYADLFLNIPRDTDGRGLVDLAVKSRFAMTEAWTFTADLHAFRVAEDGGLASPRLGEEVDVTIGRGFAGGVTVQVGGAYLFAGEALGPVRGIDQDVVFGYVMLSTIF